MGPGDAGDANGRGLHFCAVSPNVHAVDPAFFIAFACVYIYGVGPRMRTCTFWKYILRRLRRRR